MAKNTHVLSAQDLGLASKATRLAPASFSLYVRTLLQNWRQGTVACKDRGEVTSRSNKKPWKQKGTGRARAGSPRSPLWRGGGVVFGPQERTRTLKVSRALKRHVMLGLLENNLQQGNVFALDWDVQGTTPKTSVAYKALQNAGLHDKKIVFFTTLESVAVRRAFANIPTVSILMFDQPNAYDLMDGRCWVFLKKDMDAFKKMVEAWS